MGKLPDFIFLAGRRSSLRAIRETQSLKVTCHLKKIRFEQTYFSLSVHRQSSGTFVLHGID